MTEILRILVEGKKWEACMWEELFIMSENDLGKGVILWLNFWQQFWWFTKNKKCIVIYVNRLNELKFIGHWGIFTFIASKISERNTDMVSFHKIDCINWL